MLHTPVLLQETLESIPTTAKLIVDGTLGHGWHSSHILEFCKQRNQNIKLIWLDIDTKMIQKAKPRLEIYPNTKIINDSYANIDKITKPESIDFILLDLWVNMEHFKDATRGFSVKNDWQLDMRFDTAQKFSAKKLINEYKQDELSSVFQKYAEFTEKKSKEIATKIIHHRKKSKIETTKNLKQIFQECSLWEKASTVLFQAIRIEVNKEMENLEHFIEILPTSLSKWWKAAIMSYHSIEDRIVKLAFKEFAKKWRKLINKKAIKPHYTEVQKNRAARSAKFRIIEKT